MHLNTRSNHLPCAAMAATLCMASLAPAAPARAAEVPRHVYLNAGNACQGALPVSVAALRTRPLATMNEGTTTASITCILPNGGASPAMRTLSVAVQVYNAGSAEATVTCTLIDGFQEGPDVLAVYVPRTFAIPAGQARPFSFVPADVGAAQFVQPNISCGLKPGTGVTYLFQGYMEEIGS